MDRFCYRAFATALLHSFQISLYFARRAHSAEVKPLLIVVDIVEMQARYFAGVITALPADSPECSR